jgi:hypothetical protein
MVRSAKRVSNHEAPVALAAILRDARLGGLLRMRAYVWSAG